MYVCMYMYITHTHIYVYSQTNYSGIGTIMYACVYIHMYITHTYIYIGHGLTEVFVAHVDNNPDIE